MIIKKPLFDGSANDDVGLRKMIKGSTTNINNFNEIKYKWSNDLYRRMISTFWIPEIIPMADDKACYRTLSEDEKNAYNETLSFLIFLDSIQATALPSIGDYLTAPEASRLVVVQTFDECVHSQAYSYILESICDAKEISDIYYRFKDDENLNKRCQHMTNLYSMFRDNPTEENFAISLLTSYLLEGILFFNGFYYFYSLAYNDKMTKTADEIRLIERDEHSHLDLFHHIILEIKNEYPDFISDDVVKLVVPAVVQLEKDWATKVYSKGILGITPKTISDFVDYRINLILDKIGFGYLNLYPRVENPYTHLAKIAYDDGDTIKTGFFESRLTNYSTFSTMDNWEEI